MQERRHIARPGNYAEQARTYDRTRGASPTVVRAVSRYLGPPDGRTLADLAGGTGNYAQVFAARGFLVTVVDAQTEMLAHAARKQGPGPGHAVVGDLHSLPFADHSFDCVTLISALHLLADPPRALAETRRVIREGPAILQVFTSENLRTIFLSEYFPTLKRLQEEHPSMKTLERWLIEVGYDRVEHRTFVYLDTVDGSLPSLHTDALHLAGPAYLRNNSWYHRLTGDERRQGLEGLAADLRSGVLEARVKASLEEAARWGHGTVVAAWP